MVLVHDVEIGGTGNGPYKEIDHLPGVGKAVGKNQVANQQSPGGHAPLIGLQVPDLAVHLQQSFPAPAGIRAHPGILQTRFVVPVLEVGHVDLNQAVQIPQELRVFVTAAVVDDGKLQALPPGFLDRLEDLGGLVCGGDQVDVLRSPVLQREHDPHQLLSIDLAAVVQLADIVVLTEHALEVAAGEEDRAGTASAHQHRLFSVVEVGR